ncbi:beta-xylosidase family glycoside hydrolase [Streptomyces sp. NPDC054884]
MRSTTRATRPGRGPRQCASPRHVPTGQRDFEDDFSAPGLDARWVSPGQRPDRFVHSAPEGALVGHAPSESGEPSRLFTRVGGDRSEADFLVDPGEGACTVALRLDGAHWYGLHIAGGEVTAVARIGQVQSVLGSRPLPDSPVTLRVRSTGPTWNGPDDIELGIGDGTGTDVLARLDGRYLSIEVAGGFTGRLVGVWTESRELFVRRVRFAERRA